MRRIWARYHDLISVWDLDVQAVGDLDVDFHHTVEDTGIVLGGALRKALGDKVADVKASTRLTDSASCLVASAQGRDRA